MKPQNERHSRNNALAEKAFWQRPWVAAVFLLVIVFCAYQPVWHAGYVWDDDAYITNNPLLTDPDGWQRIWFSTHAQSQYFPLTYTSLRMQYNLWGFNPLGYHLFNVFLHAVNALLAWAVLRWLVVPGAWVAAAVFALHPVQVESVAWITELKNTQSTLFFFLALLSWMKFTEQETARPWRFYFLALVLYQLALFSKTTACTLPAAMILVLWLRKQPVSWRRVAQIAPFFVLGVFMGLISVWWERHLGNYEERFQLSFSWLERLFIATRAVWFYLGKLFWPVNLTFSYPKWELNPHDPAQYVWGLACVGVAVVLWLARNQTGGRSAIAASIFFVATLSPLLGFVSLFTFYYTFVADHYQYAAALGPLALGVAAINGIMANGRRSKKVNTIFWGIVLAVLGSLTWQQAGIYRNRETLWRDTIAKNPESWMACNNLALELQRAGEMEAAEYYFRRAIAIQPNDPDVRVNLADWLMAKGHMEEAVIHYEKALQIKPSDPVIENNLGTACLQLGRVHDAIGYLQKSVERLSAYASAHNNLATALRRAGREEEAIRHYEEALKAQPDFAEAHFNFGNILLRRGQLAEAEFHYRAALKIQPDFGDAYRNLEIVLRRKGRTNETIELDQQAKESLVRDR